MTITISSVPERTLVPGYHALPTLNNILARILAKLSSQFKSERRIENAIEVLRDGSASPDMCDWAERYLCGMEDADAGRYCERRRWQS